MTATAADDAAVRCTNLVHVYGEPGAEVAALRGVDLEVATGETVALLGPSGSGKSTLLWHLAGLLRPTAGTVDVRGRRLASLSPGALAAFRVDEVGIVLQNAGRNLLPYLSALDNVLAACPPSRRGDAGTNQRAHEMLETVGLAGLRRRKAGRLSGGEKQRLALAVALANRPALLLADEPTSQLDVESAADAIELIRTANVAFGTTVVVVTHDAAVGEALGRTITIRDGRIGAAGFRGEDYLVVARDGSVQLPENLADALPVGSLVKAERIADGIALHRVDVHEQPGRTE